LNYQLSGNNNLAANIQIVCQAETASTIQDGMHQYRSAIARATANLSFLKPRLIVAENNLEFSGSSFRVILSRIIFLSLRLFYSKLLTKKKIPIELSPPSQIENSNINVECQLIRFNKESDLNDFIQLNVNNCPSNIGPINQPGLIDFSYNATTNFDWYFTDSSNSTIQSNIKEFNFKVFRIFVELVKIINSLLRSKIILNQGKI
jgi:hypothetical protein